MVNYFKAGRNTQVVSPSLEPILSRGGGLSLRGISWYFMFKTHVVETGLSDYHKMISTFFKACSSKLKTKVIYYRSYKKFNESDFLWSLNKANFDFFKNDPNQNYNLLTDKFLGLADKHAPLKKKFVRGNNAPFMNREFQKEIYVRSRLRNKYCRKQSSV